MRKLKTMGNQQQRILEYIKANLKEKGYPPSVREICAAMGLKSTSTVHTHLAKLESLGEIRRDPSKPRAIDVVSDSAWRSKSMVPVPLVGRVTAGQPILAEQNVEETFPLPAELLGGHDGIFMLTVQGDSMIKAGILDGDLILVREQSSAQNGDIVVALVGGEEATVKRFFREGTRIRLQPENDALAPLYPEEVAIIGRVIGLYRQM